MSLTISIASVGRVCTLGSNDRRCAPFAKPAFPTTTSFRFSPEAMAILPSRLRLLPQKPKLNGILTLVHRRLKLMISLRMHRPRRHRQCLRDRRHRRRHARTPIDRRLSRDIIITMADFGNFTHLVVLVCLVACLVSRFSKARRPLSLPMPRTVARSRLRNCVNSSSVAL